MAVQAKFYVNAITQRAGSPGGQVELQAVTRGEENREWSKWTPAGSITMQINNPDAFQPFVDLLVASQAEGGPKPEVGITFHL